MNGESQPTFLGLEPLLVCRLKDIMTPLGVRVYSVVDAAMTKDKALVVPAVRVSFYGHDVGNTDSRAPGQSQIVQTWLVVVVAKNVRENLQGHASRCEASPYVDAVWDALDGWRPGNNYGTLRSVSPPFAAATFADGLTFIPLAFTTRFRRLQPCP